MFANVIPAVGLEPRPALLDVDKGEDDVCAQEGVDVLRPKLTCPWTCVGWGAEVTKDLLAGPTWWQGGSAGLGWTDLDPKCSKSGDPGAGWQILYNLYIMTNRKVLRPPLLEKNKFYWQLSVKIRIQFNLFQFHFILFCFLLLMVLLWFLSDEGSLSETVTLYCPC